MSGRGRGSSRLRSGRSNQPTNQDDLDYSSLPWDGKCAPRDTSTANSVDYPLTAEGGLKKFHAPFNTRGTRRLLTTQKILMRNFIL